MYDTARRVALVKQRVRENNRRRQQRGIYGLSAACMLLFAVLMQAADAFAVQGQTAAWGSFGAMLLREDAGGYVLVGVVSFAAAQRSLRCAFGSETEKTVEKAERISPPDTKRRRKANEKTNTQYLASMLHGADHAADNCVCIGERFAGQHT